MWFRWGGMGYARPRESSVCGNHIPGSSLYASALLYMHKPHFDVCPSRGKTQLPHSNTPLQSACEAAALCHALQDLVADYSSTCKQSQPQNAVSTVSHR